MQEEEQEKTRKGEYERKKIGRRKKRRMRIEKENEK